MMSQQDLPTLFYSGKSNSAVPIISESELQTITAEPWLEISKKGLQLEGLNFDRQGQLFPTISQVLMFKISITKLARSI